jgi:ribonuclease P protein component
MNLSAHPKIHVIKKNSEIKQVLSQGKKIHTKYGILFLYDKTQGETFRFAVLIKRQVGNAVKRNYCKRIVRSYIRNRINTYLKNYKVIVMYNFDGDINYNLLMNEFDNKLAIE